MKIKAELVGLSAIKKRFERFGVEGEEIVQSEVKDASNTIVQTAKNNAPKNFGKLAQGIKSREVTPYIFDQVAEEPYSAYIEFGTGSKVQVPAELSELASKFRGGRGGSFKKGLENIKAWCKKKGIPQEAAYPIFMKILRVGVSPQPFLYPAFKIGRVNFVKGIEANFIKLTKKYSND